MCGRMKCLPSIPILSWFFSSSSRKGAVFERTQERERGFECWCIKVRLCWCIKVRLWEFHISRGKVCLTDVAPWKLKDTSSPYVTHRTSKKLIEPSLQDEVSNLEGGKSVRNRLMGVKGRELEESRKRRQFPGPLLRWGWLDWWDQETFTDNL